MTDAVTRLRNPEAVTFDCWATLLRELKPAAGAPGRAERFAAHVGVDAKQADAALAAAWRQHQIAWHRREIVDGPIMTRQAVDALGVELDAAAMQALVEELEELALAREVVALDGARDALADLAGRGVRIALICDTGFTPGRVVRQLLDRVGLLEFLEVTVFSNEVGHHKPHPKMFETALAGLGVEPACAVHVGDLKRSDVAGARAYGMGSVRLSQHNDDDGSGAGFFGAGVIDCGTAGCEPHCERPEADAVAPSYARLLELLR